MVDQKWYQTIALSSLFGHRYVLFSKLKGHRPLNSIEPVSEFTDNKNYLW
jgi:hypothetical protein